MLELKTLASAAVFVTGLTLLSPYAQGGCGVTVGQNALDLPFKNLKSEIAQKESKGNKGIDSITGLWKFTFTVPGPNNTEIVVDAGFQTWHADGTELMNSGRPPITSSFCMGVWEWIAPRTYRLNHFALPWNSSGTAPLGTDNIKLLLKLGSSGDTFTGTFSVDEYDPNGYSVFHAEGDVAGTRIRVE